MKQLFLILMLPLILSTNVYGQDYGTAKVTKINSVYDGDTFRVDLEGYKLIFGENIPITLNGVDTPEIRGKCKEEKEKAILARDFTKQHLEQGGSVVLQNMQRGKYFRIAADVVIDDKDLGKLLLEQGLARSYDGGKKSSWCQKKKKSITRKL